uniref:Uncharacterized protein n=1 Tax=Ralstonia phage BOESR1 TaxID=3034917 RepID=A0AA50F2U0_9CAUD|nr:hypothetical protein HIBIKMCM_00010 [Ralstonia phage BOESR1]
MEFEVKQKPAEPAFEPITVTFTIENRAELAAFVALGGRNVSVADFLQAKEGDSLGFDRNVAKNVFAPFYHKLKPLLA